MKARLVGDKYFPEIELELEPETEEELELLNRGYNQVKPNPLYIDGPDGTPIKVRPPKNGVYEIADN
jgi:hypothetical protein